MVVAAGSIAACSQLLVEEQTDLGAVAIARTTPCHRHLAADHMSPGSDTSLAMSAREGFANIEEVGEGTDCRRLGVLGFDCMCLMKGVVLDVGSLAAFRQWMMPFFGREVVSS